MSEWSKANLGSLISLEYGSSLPERARSGDGQPVVGSAGILGYHAVATQSGPGIVVGRKGTVGALTWLDSDFSPIDTTYWVRPIRKLDLRWLFLAMERLGLRRLDSSTGVPGLNRNDAYGLAVEVPPLSEQRRIGELLDTLDESIAGTHRLVDKQSRLAEGLEHSIFERLRLGPTTRLDQLASVDRGRFTARPRNDPALYGGPYPFAQTGDVSASSRGLLTSASQTLNERGRLVSRSFPGGSIAVTIAANIADTAMLQAETYFPDSVVGVVPHDLSTARWIEMCIHRHKPRLEAIAPQSAQKNINLEDLRPLGIPNVAVSDRRRYSALYEDCDRVLRAERDRLKKLLALRAGLADDLLTGRVRTVPM